MLSEFNRVAIPIEGHATTLLIVPSASQTLSAVELVKEIIVRTFVDRRLPGRHFLCC